MSEAYVSSLRQLRGHFSHEYDIFNAVVRVAFKIPDDFPELIGDLIRKLVVSID